MKPAWCRRLRDLIAKTDLRRRMSVRRFPGIDRRVIPRWFAQVRRSPLRFQNGRMMPLRESSAIFSLIQTQFIITCSHRSMHSPPNLKSSAVILHFPAALSFFSDFTAFRTSSSVTSSPSGTTLTFSQHHHHTTVADTKIYSSKGNRNTIGCHIHTSTYVYNEGTKHVESLDQSLAETIAQSVDKMKLLFT